jgi:predicted PurR-regulated permease PerM
MTPKPTQRREPARRSLLAQEPLLLLAVVVIILYVGRSILVPLALALTLSFLLGPTVAKLQRRRLPRVPATLLVMAAATGLLGGIVWLVAGQLLNVVNDLPNHTGNIRAKLAFTHVPTDSRIGQAVASLEGLGQELSGHGAVPTPTIAAPSHEARPSSQASLGPRHAPFPPAAMANTPDSPGSAAGAGPAQVIVVEPPSTQIDYLRQILVPVLGPLGTAGMVLVFTLYMLLKREDLRNRLLLLAGIGRLNIMTRALDDAAERVSRYLTANVTVNAGCGIVFACGLYAIGVPNATLWGALLALLRMVPYLGPLVGGALPAIFALVIFPTWWQAVCVVALIGSLEAAVANFLEPWFYGSHTGISELALVVMAIFWTLLWGWPGLALATPLTVCLIVTGRVLPQMSFLHILLGDEAELAPEAHFYERLLAMDQAEAHTVADRFLEQRSTLELYDQVLLPALGLAEQDRHQGMLGEERAQFLLQSAQELIEELTEHGPRDLLTGQGSGSPLEAGPTGSSFPASARACPVVCVPTSDQADEIAATMLAQLLERAGHKTLLLPASALSPELLTRFAEDKSTAVCISAVPPLAFVPARALCARLRRELPANRILVALWGSTSSPETLRARFGSARPDSVVCTLAAALKEFSSDALERPAEFMFARSGPAREARAEVVE